MPSVVTGAWSLIAGSGVFSSSSSPQTGISGIATGNNRFLWSTINGTCPPSYDTLEIFVDQRPTVAFANKDQAVCSETITMQANAPTTGTGSWQLISGSGHIVDSTSNTAAITSLTNGISIFRWNIKNGVCPVSFDEMVVSRDLPPSIASSGIKQQVDIPDTQLAAEVPTIGIGSWRVIEGIGIINDTLDPNSNIRSLSVGDNIIRWTVRNGVCPESSSDLLIYLSPLRIPNGFSPNGDDFNDNFVIPGIDFYDHVDFAVFNRWGGLVYHNKNYKNDWNGANLNNEQLADDTYYFTLKVSPEMDYSGYVIIKTTK